MGDFGSLVVGFAVVAAIAVAVAVIAGGFIYIVTTPVIIIPVLCFIAFLVWRNHNKGRV